jgi:hypothetical protein
MFDYETRMQLANDRVEQLRNAALAPGIAIRPTLGDWLVRLGRRLMDEPRARRSALAHEALPRC